MQKRAWKYKGIVFTFLSNKSRKEKGRIFMVQFFPKMMGMQLLAFHFP